MRRVLLGLGLALAGAGDGHAASAVNRDGEARMITVTDAGGRQEVEVAAGETVEFCLQGCFVTMPNGDREALEGSETLEILNGAARVR